MRRFINFLVVLGLACASAQAQDKSVPDWPDFGRYEESNASVGTGVRVVLMGDSITDNWAKEDPAYFEKNGFVCRGISGQTASQMLCRFSQDVLALEPEAVVIMAGTNDLCQQMAGMAYYPERNVFGNIKAMCELALSENIDVLLCSVTPVAHYMPIPELDAASEIRKLNDRLRAYAETREDVTWVDYHTPLAADDGGLSPAESYDGVHPKINAYSRMERILNEALSEVLGEDGFYSIPQDEADRKAAEQDAVRRAKGLFMNFDEAVAMMDRPRSFTVPLYDGDAPGSEGWPQPEVTVEYMSPFWNEMNTCVYNVSRPSMEVWLPFPGTATGAAVVVCPGGGFQALSYSNEGPAVAEWLSRHGIAAFVLKYRTPYTGDNVEDVRRIALSNYGGEPRTDEIKALAAEAAKVAESQGYSADMAVADGRRAMEIIRGRASEWGVDPDKVGMVGFSAGGALVSRIALDHTDADRPDFIGLVYGAMYGDVVVPEDLEDTVVMHTNSWLDILSYLTGEESLAHRTARIDRKTKETEIDLFIDLDGTGEGKIESGIPFLDHMLEQIVRHSRIDFTGYVNGDIDVDFHHTTEDIAIVLGEAILSALGEKRGIERYGFETLMMDDVVVTCAIDFSSRPEFIFDVDFTLPYVGTFPTELIRHFFRSFSNSAKCNLYLSARCGGDSHHTAEALFKAFARSIRKAVRRIPGETRIQSTKGKL